MENRRKVTKANKETLTIWSHFRNPKFKDEIGGDLYKLIRWSAAYSVLKGVESNRGEIISEEALEEILNVIRINQASLFVVYVMYL